VALVVFRGVDHTTWERRSRGFGRGAARDEDLERTVALDGAAADRALDETLPLHEAAARGIIAPRAAGHDAAGFYPGSPVYPEYGSYDGPSGGFPPQGDASGLDGAAGGRRPTRRRVLLAAGGLTLLGGCGIATAARLASAGSTRPAAAPTPSRSPSRGPVAPPAAPTGTPADLSSSSAAASPSAPPPDTGDPGVNPALVQSVPQFYVHGGPKSIALTLDDGPSAQYTPQVLSLLQRHRITAAFCMVGEQIAANRSLVSEIAAAGHTIVNHTWNHADQSKLGAAAIRSQIARTSDALGTAQAHPTLFRAPYGSWSHAVFQECARARLRPLDWSVDPRDWSRPGTNTIVSRIMAQTRTGSIILEHDGGGDRSQTVAALKIVIPRLLDEGYRFISV
jgi:peptidoglycan/xylan/chitin deacetylase (PgdA/CDA1 family)